MAAIMTQAPHERTLKEAGGEAPRKWQLSSRLLISIPALMVLFTFGMGVICDQVVLSFFERETAPVAAAPAAPGARASPGARAAPEKLKDVLPPEQLSANILLATILISCLAAVAGFFLARSIVDPLRTMEARLDELTATGRIDSIPDSRGLPPEIGRLSERFKQALVSLRDYVAERDRYILECFTGSLVLLDRDGLVMTMNSATQEMLGLKANALTGRNFEEWLRSIDRDAPLAGAIRAAFRDGAYADSRELELQTPSLGRFPILVTVSPLQKTQESGSGLAINFRDLRRYKQFYAEMARADHLAALGAFATGIAHEIRNPLGSVKGMAQLLAEDMEGGSKARQYADVIVRQADRLDAVVRGLLEFAQPDVSPAEEADLGRLLSEALSLSREGAGEARIGQLKLVEDYQPVLRVRVQAERVRQALANVIRNAIEAAPPGGIVRVSTCQGEVSGGKTMCEARVANTGEPIPDELVTRIFDPFFTTKPGATGLGLAIASQAVTANGGQIHVERAGDETVFRVCFPAV